jgi:hypothetical protein
VLGPKQPINEGVEAPSAGAGVGQQHLSVLVRGGAFGDSTSEGNCEVEVSECLRVWVEVTAEDEQFGDVDQMGGVGIESLSAVDDCGQVTLGCGPGDRPTEARLGKRVAPGGGLPPGLAVEILDVDLQPAVRGERLGDLGVGTTIRDDPETNAALRAGSADWCISSRAASAGAPAIRSMRFRRTSGFSALFDD